MTMDIAIWKRSRRRNRAKSLLLALSLSGPVLAQQAPEADPLLDMSLEQLGDIEITSVSRRSERLSDAPASIYVISNEDIRRSGATSLPEALRLAPNLQVARVSSTTYAISARGFNNSLGNKLLVLIDGRTVYTPLFSGVFWDAQDAALEDIDRIEVISGPGATLWGANAVNGVINVITRPAAETQGLLVSVAGGGEGRRALARYGGRWGEGGSFRLYAKRRLVDKTESSTDLPMPDRWNSGQFGFRADWGGAEQSLTLQGDAYRGKSEERAFGPIEISGMNVLAGWNQTLGEGSRLHMQVYFDRSERDDPLLFHDRMDIVDFEFQHGIAAGKQDILWGGGYRRARDRVLPGLLSTFIPAHKTLHWENLFVQDEIRLRETLRLTLGIKLDRNVYTGTEVLPSLRLAWKPDARQLLWGELSRAVRAPSRIDREFFLPGAPPFLIQGGPRFVSEVADVVELGYRAQPVEAFSYSLTLFHHRYDRLRSGQPQAGGYFQVENGTAGTITGIEAWANLRASERWRLSGGLSTLNQSFRTKPGSNDPDGPVDLGNDPRYQWNLRSTFAWTPSLEFNLLVRGVGELPDPRIPAYTAVDANLRWQPDPHIEIGLFLQNVTGSGHIEFAPGPLAVASEYDRSAYLELLWRW